ncbi:MAG TPA: PilX N-terminal domain-containing pilus assembly protein [Vicinamibacteria bacterium]|nr:PilX N-terminal domain-containing pilus assembly protein [Vicinamibacteria bacterium]
MRTPQPSGARGRSQGFALVLAILALLLLTFLGLTLAVSTTTELQIATNYKWAQQARFNAEAGIEVGKRILRDLDWTQILPAVRTGAYGACGTILTPPSPLNSAAPGCWPAGNAPAAAASAHSGAARDNENAGCDLRGNTGYGVVLSDGVNVYQNVSTVAVPSFAPNAASGTTIPLRGAFTLWVRRAMVEDQLGRFGDDSDNTTLILTSEGTAPFAPIATAGQQASFNAVNRAVYVMEVLLSNYVLPPCGTRGGQTGGSQAGAGYAACTSLGDDAVSRELATIGGNVGTGAQINGGTGK